MRTPVLRGSFSIREQYVCLFVQAPGAPMGLNNPLAQQQQVRWPCHSSHLLLGPCCSTTRICQHLPVTFSSCGRRLAGTKHTMLPWPRESCSAALLQAILVNLGLLTGRLRGAATAYAAAAANAAPNAATAAASTAGGSHASAHCTRSADELDGRAGPAHRSRSDTTHVFTCSVPTPRGLSGAGLPG